MKAAMICGLDEAGRGPLAGPVCAAAVVLPENFPFELLADSKKLSEQRREQAMRAVYRKALAWGVGWASNVEIDKINILKASLLAMERAYWAMMDQPGTGAALGLQADEAIVDGLYAPSLPIPCRTLVRADSIIPSVMAASILAKTARDRMMKRYSWIYPEWCFERHKGYPTREHRCRIARFGPSPIQRLSFNSGPIQAELFNGL